MEKSKIQAERERWQKIKNEMGQARNLAEQVRSNFE